METFLVKARYFYLDFFFLFLGSGPDRGRSPVEWGEIPFVHLFVRPSVPPLWLALKPYWLALRPCWLALRPLQLALRPFQPAFRPFQQGLRPL